MTFVWVGGAVLLGFGSVLTGQILHCFLAIEENTRASALAVGRGTEMASPLLSMPSGESTASDGPGEVNAAGLGDGGTPTNRTVQAAAEQAKVTVPPGPPPIRRSGGPTQ